jgi:hypothetical protein
VSTSFSGLSRLISFFLQVIVHELAQQVQDFLVGQDIDAIVMSDMARNFYKAILRSDRP